MGCPAFVKIGGNLTFSVCTSDPTTSALTDADAPPAYRVYEDETGTAILTGSMALLDDANTTGFYSEQIACTIANGFEADKNYSVYISGAVGGTTGGTSYSFVVESPAAGAGAITFTYTLTNVDGGAPIPGADVWATSDIAGLYTVASGVTNTSGEVVFYLDAGTYYIWRQLAGWNFTNPDTEVVA